MTMKQSTLFQMSQNIAPTGVSTPRNFSLPPLSTPLHSVPRGGKNQVRHFSSLFRCLFCWIWTHSLEREEMWPLYFTNINGHIKQILEQHHYSDNYVLNLKRHSRKMFFVRPLYLLRFSCNQCFKKGQ